MYVCATPGVKAHDILPRLGQGSVGPVGFTPSQLLAGKGLAGGGRGFSSLGPGEKYQDLDTLMAAAMQGKWGTGGEGPSVSPSTHTGFKNTPAHALWWYSLELQAQPPGIQAPPTYPTTLNPFGGQRQGKGQVPRELMGAEFRGLGQGYCLLWAGRL